MKHDVALKQELIRFAAEYGKKTFGNNYAHPNELKNSSLIFNDLEFSFQKDSWNAICQNTDFEKRTQKKHTKVQTKNAGILEMQSSNSSDALAMNIFCHPDFKRAKGIMNLFQVKEITTVVFGHKAKVDKTINGAPKKDNTEIDVFLNDNILIECKLTEKDFSSKDKYIVEHYSDFRKVFDSNKLLQTPTQYKNYQLIRNILAANQYKFQFILICDKRRPDLVESFNQTVNCIKDYQLKSRCKIIYWQDLTKVVGDELKSFLKEKYGI